MAAESPPCAPRNAGGEDAIACSDTDREASSPTPMAAWPVIGVVTGGLAEENSAGGGVSAGTTAALGATPAAVTAVSVEDPEADARAATAVATKDPVVVARAATVAAGGVVACVPTETAAVIDPEVWMAGAGCGATGMGAVLGDATTAALAGGVVTVSVMVGFAVGVTVLVGDAASLVETAVGDAMAVIGIAATVVAGGVAAGLVASVPVGPASPVSGAAIGAMGVVSSSTTVAGDTSSISVAGVSGQFAEVGAGASTGSGMGAAASFVADSGGMADSPEVVPAGIALGMPAAVPIAPSNAASKPEPAA
jgi:hypothetical protein